MTKMAREFNVALLMRRKGNKYTEEGFTKFLESHGFMNIKVGKSDDGFIRIQARQPVVKNGQDRKEPRAIFIKCNDEMIIEEIKWTNGFTSSVGKMNKDATQGGFILIGIIVLLAIVISTCVNMVGSDSDTDCNDTYIEKDYNGDGEKDAEDFRIQTEGC